MSSSSPPGPSLGHYLEAMTEGRFPSAPGFLCKTGMFSGLLSAVAWLNVSSAQLENLYLMRIMFPKLPRVGRWNLGRVFFRERALKPGCSVSVLTASSQISSLTEQ